MSKIIDFARQQVGKPYVFGTSGPDSFDCSGLTKRAVKLIGLDWFHGATQQWLRGSQTGQTDRYGYWGESGTIESLPEKVAFLFNQDKKKDKIVMSHTGLYDGHGKVIQAGGQYKGVSDKPINKSRWTHWGTLNEYWTGRDEGVGLSKGSGGAEVKAFQEKLILLGHDLGKWGADGKFGEVTEGAVKAFQAEHALPVNGVWGEAEEKLANDLKPEPIDNSVLLNELDGIADRIKVITKALRG